MNYDHLLFLTLYFVNLDWNWLWNIHACTVIIAVWTNDSFPRGGSSIEDSGNAGRLDITQNISLQGINNIFIIPYMYFVFILKLTVNWYILLFPLQCLRDNVELLCNAAEMFYNAGDYNNAKSFFQRVIYTWTCLKCYVSSLLTSE